MVVRFREVAPHRSYSKYMQTHIHHPTSRAPEFVVLNAKHAVRSDGVRDDIIGDGAF